jgi:hypothetical protein
MRLADFRGQIVLRQGGLDARCQIAAIRLIVGVLELAPAAFWEMSARRLLVMRSEGERAIVEHGVAGHSERDVATARRHAVAACCDPDDEFVHSPAMASGIASARSSAIS